jgi:exonuclease VII large subunit
MKNEYIQKASSRLKQEIKVLVSKPSFLNAVLILRKKWKIPNEGFRSQTDLDKWYQKINEDTEEYFNQFWPSKRQKLVELKSKGNFLEHKKTLDEFNNKAPRNVFLIDVKKLTQKQKLSPRWTDGIKRFLLSIPASSGTFLQLFTG